MAGGFGGVARRLGGYRIIAPLATGGMAELFIAKTAGVSGFEKQVALKVIHPNYSSDPDFVKMLVDEAKLAVQLQHANIVQTYDLGQVDGQYYIAMELIDGADLYKILKTSSEREHDFPIDVAAYITAEVASGLDYAHRKNDPMGRPLQIVHRDVSPQNVLVSREGEVKIVDFGIAKAALRGQHTQAGVIKGKYFYMSPEQSWGEKIDARTDVFSTGILLHEMLCGEMLYLEEDLDKLLKLVRAADIKPPSRKRADVPPELDAIVLKALAKRPADRYQTAADLATALTRFLRTRYPEAGRGRVAKFVRNVLEEEEPSHVDIAVPPPRPEDFSHEHSLIFRLTDLELDASRDTSENMPGDLRHADEETRGVAQPILNTSHGDYEDGGATEFDPSPQLGPRKPNLGPDFGQVGDDAEPTEFAGRKLPALPAVAGFTGPDDEFTDSESTRQRPSMPLPAARPVPPPARPPASPRRSLPPLATPSRTPRPAMGGLGVSRSTPHSMNEPPPRADAAVDERLARDLAARPQQPMSGLGGGTPTPITPQPVIGFGGGPTTGEQPLVDWSAAATVTPPLAAPYPRGPELEGGSGLHRPADLQRRKLLIVAGLALVCLIVVLAGVFLWPEGPARGTAEVVSFPAGATVRVDGTVLPKSTPIRINDLDVKQPHHLSVSLRGYDTWESDVSFKDAERDVRLQAILAPAVGTIQISTVPSGAEAIVNQRIAGTTPTKVGDLPPNEDVTVELRLRGYKIVYETVPWKGKRALTISVPLEKAR
ncbi:MAG: protein kinase [Polyangia bacterium]